MNVYLCFCSIMDIPTLIEPRVVRSSQQHMITMLLLTNLVNIYKLYSYLNQVKDFKIKGTNNDEYLLGNLNQPKYGHLKQLHDVFHAMEKTLTYGNISTADFGNLVMVILIFCFFQFLYLKYVTLEFIFEHVLLQTTVYQTEEGSSCFIGNVNAKINFQGTSYDVPAWYVSILPDCKTESYNTAKVCLCYIQSFFYSFS